ncbi:MAG: hypothetical protein ACFE9Z_11450 [Promethearchaeota archaeon]
MIGISNLFFPSGRKEGDVECPFCKYVITKPYPKDQLCPKCNKFLAQLFDQTIDIEEKPPPPQEFKTRTETLASKLSTKVKVKKEPYKKKINLDQDKIELMKGEYIKLMGITSIERTQLYCSNKNYNYLLELANNLDFIATGILGGELDKMLLISETNAKEKCQFYVKDKIIYLVYGSFPDKKGKWILEQMSNNFSEILQERDVEILDKFDKYNLELEFRRRTKFILEQYVNELQEVFTDQEIPHVDETIRIDYLGLSSMSIGVISILINGEQLIFESLGEYDNPEEEKEMKESMLTARVEAIAANTQGNTGATPRWIAVKLGFQRYRFFTFKKYQNDYFLSMLSEGNLSKIEDVEKLLNPLIEEITSNVFSGNLKPFNELKMKLVGNFEKRSKFPPFEFN